MISRLKATNAIQSVVHVKMNCVRNPPFTRKLQVQCRSVTNVPENEIRDLIKFQQSEYPRCEETSFVLRGCDTNGKQTSAMRDRSLIGLRMFMSTCNAHEISACRQKRGQSKNWAESIGGFAYYHLRVLKQSRCEYSTKIPQINESSVETSTQEGILRFQAFWTRWT